MPTKLSRLCDGLLEALWLVAIIAVPVFFNIYSSRIFEPDKLTLLRSIALTMLFVWIVKICETGIKKGSIKEIFKDSTCYPSTRNSAHLHLIYFILCFAFHKLMGILPAFTGYLYDAFLSGCFLRNGCEFTQMGAN